MKKKTNSITFTIGSFQVKRSRPSTVFISPKKFFGCFLPSDKECCDECFVATKKFFGGENNPEKECDMEILEMNVNENELKQIIQKEEEIIMIHKKVLEFKEKVNKKELPELLKRLKREQISELKKEWNRICNQYSENPTELEKEWKKLVFKYQN